VQLRHRYRQVANAANLTTPLGLMVALVGRARTRPGPRGLVLATGYRLPVPAAAAFTMGNVILTRLPAERLLGDRRLLAHEERHTWQYVALGGVFYWPLYGLATAWSWLWTGDRGAANVFERLAGLADGGYRSMPPRAWWAARMRRLAGRDGVA